MNNPISFNLVFRNFGYKIAALVLALLIWGIVQGDEILEINRRIKVNFSVADGYMVKDKPFRFVDAKLRGPRFIMGEYLTRPIEAKVMIASGQVGPLEIPFDSKNIKDWDERIKIQPRDPYISIFVDEKVTRTVPIREILQGAPAEGFFVEKVTMQPDKIKLSGLKSDVSKLVDVVTEPIDISGIKQSKTIEATVVTLGYETDGRDANDVKVTLQVGDSKINKRFSNIPVRIVGNADKVTQIQPKVVSIVIQGTPGILSFVTRNDLRAFIEVTDLAPGRHEKEIQVKIPPDTVLIETFPTKGVVSIREESSGGL